MSQPQRIVIFSTAYLPFIGGAEVAIREITDRIGDSFVFDVFTAKMNRLLPSMEHIGNVTVYRVGIGSERVDKYWLAFFGHWKALRCHRRAPYAIIWSVMASYNGFAALAFKKKTNLPFLLGKNMSRYTLNYTNYATYDNLTIIGGTNKLSKHIQTPRILIRRTGSILCATYSDQPELVESTIYITTSNKINLKYLLGVLNSKALTFYLKQKLITNAQGFPQILMGQLYQLPIPNINSKNIAQQTHHESIVKNVDAILQLNNQLLPSATQTTQIKRRMDYLIDEIDNSVFSLYGIRNEEQKVVENG